MSGVEKTVKITEGNLQFAFFSASGRIALCFLR